MAAADVSRRVNAERIVLVGWLRALLLQLAHPLIAAGVAGHSSFRGSTAAALSRLHETVAAMLAITFGTHEQQQAALDRIRAIHRRVHGTLAMRVGCFDAGTPYSAEDSELLIWVHATLAESIVLAYEQFVGPLTATERDAYCADSADVAVALGARADAAPRSWRAVREHVQNGCASGRIAVGPQALMLSSRLLAPLGHPAARAMVTPAIALLAAGQLPSYIRSQYRLPWNDRRARRFTRVVALLRGLRSIAPRPVACWKIARSAHCLVASHGYSPTG
jgi:uncharacterized protein (DUF2236 family)